MCGSLFGLFLMGIVIINHLGKKKKTVQIKYKFSCLYSYAFLINEI